jgi:hypothetical protein
VPHVSQAIGVRKALILDGAVRRTADPYRVIFDEHLNRQHRLTYFVRGPEWAFAVPQGDLGALEDVMRRCSSFWNGAGSVLVPVRADGRIPRAMSILLRTRPVDTCWLHERLSAKARAAIARRIPEAALLWDRFDEHELHPLHLIRKEPADRPPEDALEVPRFHSARLQRASLAAWGHINEEDYPYWRERYSIGQPAGDDAHGAMLRGQVEGQSASPLRLTTRHMGLVRQENASDRPYIWILSEASFNDLVGFWNFRARLLAQANGAPVVGILRESLCHPEQLGALTAWVPRLPSTRLTPDFYVACGSKFDDEVRNALATVGFAEDTNDRERREIGREVTPNDPPTFRFARPILGGPFIRGTSASALVAIAAGRTSLSLARPETFAVRSFAHTRLIFQNLPLPLPLTPAAARHVHTHATARDGVVLSTDAAERWDFDIQLPTASEALDYWITDHGFGLTRSQDGRDAEALLRRLGSHAALDVLADRKRFALLQVLAPQSRKKLAQRLVSEAKRAGSSLDEAQLAERLSDLGLFIEVQARTASEIASTMGARTTKRQVFELLVPLVEAGFVRRGTSMRCPQCRFRMMLDLAEHDERTRCRACGESFILPVTGASGQTEPEWSYRLDGLMARAMDQDVVPVLLALRALWPPVAGQALFFAWPGVELTTEAATSVEIDLLVSDGDNVWCFEVKQTAGGLKERQLRKLLDVATRLEARPGIAAAEGEFSPALAKLVQDAGGRVLAGDDLFH